MAKFSSARDRDAIEAEAPWPPADLPATLYGLLSQTAARQGDRPAISFQLTAGPRDPAKTLSWAALHQQVTRAANLFRAHGIGETDTIAFLLPNCLEAAVVLLGGAVAGVVAPINPLLEPAQIAAILRESGARALVTLRAFPRTDIAAKAAAALALAPGVTTVFEVDLCDYLSPPRAWIVPLIRPRHRPRHGARVLSFARALRAQPGDRLGFADAKGDRIAACFHTGGTTGMPKLARHRYAGMLYNGWLGARLVFEPGDVMICPLPLFHVFAAYPILMSCMASGAHMVMPTPAGYRGEGVIENFWALIERWQVSFLITVPTAIAALMQRPVNADVSSLRTAISGSAPLPVELYNRFLAATGVEIAEGYGLTEATCLVSCNPPGGMKKVGSVGLPMPHSAVRILRETPDGGFAPCETGQVGEICLANPGVHGQSPHVQPDPERRFFAQGQFLRTGDLGRLDGDGYLWITGRAKDLIIRGGHNIDPAQIEEAMLAHPAVAFAGAIGQPDSFAGELPCVYLELLQGAAVSLQALQDHARTHIPERAAIPKHIEILPELPKTAVGKIFKPGLRRLAIARVLDASLAEAGLGARVLAVVEDPGRGLVAQIGPAPVDVVAALHQHLGRFALPYDLQPTGDPPLPGSQRLG